MGGEFDKRNASAGPCTERGNPAKPGGIANYVSWDDPTAQSRHLATALHLHFSDFEAAKPIDRPKNVMYDTDNITGIITGNVIGLLFA